MLAGIDRGQPQAVGVRVALDRLDVADKNVRPLLADGCDLFGLQTGHGEAVGELLERQAGVDELVEPAQGDFH